MKNLKARLHALFNRCNNEPIARIQGLLHRRLVVTIPGEATLAISLKSLDEEDFSIGISQVEKFNTFIGLDDMSAGEITDLILSFDFNAENGDFIRSRSTKLISAVVNSLVWMRDEQERPFGVRDICKALSFSNLYGLWKNDQLPEGIRAELGSYFDTLPGFASHHGTNQEAIPNEHHGLMQKMLIFTLGRLEEYLSNGQKNQEDQEVHLIKINDQIIEVESAEICHKTLRAVSRALNPSFARRLARWGVIVFCAWLFVTVFTIDYDKHEYQSLSDAETVPSTYPAFLPSAAQGVSADELSAMQVTSQDQQVRDPVLGNVGLDDPLAK